MEKIKIFLLFLLCWSTIRAISFITLSLLDFKKNISNSKEFIFYLGTLLLGIFMIPFTALFNEWWFYGILTILYFLFGGGVVVFIIITVIGLIVCNIPMIFSAIMFKSLAKDTKNEIKKKQLNCNTPYDCVITVINEYILNKDSQVFSEVATELKQYIKKFKTGINENIANYNEDKSINELAVRQIVVQFLLKFIDMKLTSGQFHIYRGVLNDYGNKLLKLYKEIIKDLIKLEMNDEDTKNKIDEEWIQRNINSLVEDIKNIG